jgi:hypothetical protein
LAVLLEPPPQNLAPFLGVGQRNRQFLKPLPPKL